MVKIVVVVAVVVVVIVVVVATVVVDVSSPVVVSCWTGSTMIIIQALAHSSKNKR